MAVRARRFFGPRVVTTANAWHAMYTVPAGRTLVIKSADFASFNTNVHAFWGTERDDAAGVGIIYGTAVGGGIGVAALGGVVLNPGQTLYAYCDTANTLWAGGSGSLLAGAPL